MQMLLNAYNHYQIDIALLNETSTKQISVSLNKIEKVLKLLGRESKIIGANSATSSSLSIDYLLGGLLIIIREKSVALLQEESIIKEALGNWIAMKLKNE